MAMRRWNRGSTQRTILVVAALTASCLAGGATSAQDTDSDGVPDASDNCFEVSNPSQRDDSGDGIGDLCDPDFDDDGIVGVVDYTIFRASYQQTVTPAPPYVDLDDDDHVGASDAVVFLNRFGDASRPTSWTTGRTWPRASSSRRSTRSSTTPTRCSSPPPCRSPAR